MAANIGRERLKVTELKEKPIEMRFSVPDPWARQLFIALARRYGLKPYRMARMHRQTVLLKGPASFLEGVLWPEFQELSRELSKFLADITQRVISEEVFADTADATEVPEPRQLGL